MAYNLEEIKNIFAKYFDGVYSFEKMKDIIKKTKKVNGYIKKIILKSSPNEIQKIFSQLKKDKLPKEFIG